MKYAVVIEPSRTGFGASVVDLPGCVSVGSSLEDVREQIKEAIEFHMEGMLEDGEPIPPPSIVEFIDVQIPSTSAGRTQAG